jgi:phosphoglucosamine mutase
MPQVLKNIRVYDKSAVTADEMIQSKIAEITKELEGRGRILLRESGTEPVIRVMAECDEYKTCEMYVDKMINLIKKRGYGSED